MVTAENLVKNFHGFAALDHVSMHVPKGVIYGLVGPNGAGKSTIIRHIAGIYRPDNGQVLVDGVPVYENSFVKSRIAYIPDDLYYFFQASTLEMKHFYANLYPEFDKKLFDRLQEFFPSINPKQSIRRLSKGMQKQSAFWLALCCNPSLLVLDEPVDGLDPVMRRQIWNLILKRVEERGTTVLISSHNLRELEDVCNYVGIMHKGRILLERSLSELQGSVVKLQIVFEESDAGIPALPPQLQVLHMSNLGRVYTIIARGEPEELRALLAPLHPLLVDILPLSLEEIFIYEMGGADYAVKDILF